MPRCVVCGKDLEECGCQGFDTEPITLKERIEFLKSLEEEGGNGRE